MITIYQFPRTGELPNQSPFCMKVELFFKVNKIPYKVKNVMNTKKTPRGKLPYIKDGEITVSDSSMILDYVKKKYHTKLDDHLDSYQESVAEQIITATEECLYWYLVWFRWWDNEGYQQLFNGIKKGIPYILHPFFHLVVRKSVKEQLFQQGTGRFTKDELLLAFEKKMHSLSNLIQNKSYLFNQQISTVDIVLFSSLGNVFFTYDNFPLKTIMMKHKNLVNYCENFKKNHI